jgi:hypothetical protein
MFMLSSFTILGNVSKMDIFLNVICKLIAPKSEP